MCTALSLITGDHLFGRTLDLERSYGESVVITPRRFPLRFCCQPEQTRHHAILGMACLQEGRPLYYDAMNEHGLGIAALNFPHSAVYSSPEEDNWLAPYEVIPYLLGRCTTAQQAAVLLGSLSVARQAVSSDLPCTPLHWMLADSRDCFVAEPREDGVRIYRNPVRVLTNEPPFPRQLDRLNDYVNLSPLPAENRFSPTLNLTAFSRGMGAMGLPGDFSSQSRFVRAAFVSQNARKPHSTDEAVARFFQLMACVSVPRGSVRLPQADVETVYTACCDPARCIYYYTTAQNPSISAVALHHTDLEADKPISYPLAAPLHIHWQSEAPAGPHPWS